MLNQWTSHLRGRITRERELQGFVREVVVLAVHHSAYMHPSSNSLQKERLGLMGKDVEPYLITRSSKVWMASVSIKT